MRHVSEKTDLCTLFWWENVKERGCLEHQGTGGRIIFKLTVHK